MNKMPYKANCKSARQVAYKPLTTFMREASATMRVIAGTVVMTFTMLILQPAAMAAQTALGAPAKAPHGISDEGKMAKTLQRVESQLTRMEGKLASGQRTAQDTTNEKAELVLMKNDIKQLDKTVLANFKAVEDHIVSHNLSDVILKRHQAAVTKYQMEMNTLLQNVDAVDQAATDEERKLAIQHAKQHLQSSQHKRGHHPFDPNRLPFSVPDDTVRKPYEKKEDFQALLYEPKPVQVAAVTLPPGLLATDGTIPLPQPADTQSTEDVQISTDIQALATSLNNDPVKIYNWVHNNIEFMPTYGSIQGSQMTLETKKGNAFDTASLLIALLRAANIPARYAYGTVQMPVDKVMNWVGNVTAPEAALQILGQGGIPSVGMTQGGVIKYVKLEHVWAEAWVDYQPSRGAKNIQGDSWVPLDASYKQYTYTQGTDLQTAVPFDAQALVDQVSQTSTANATEGWVSGVDENAVQTALVNYQTQVQDYLTNNNPNATVGDILGTKTINQRSTPTLAMGLPYELIIQASSLSALPTSTRHQFRFKLYASQLDTTLDSPVFSYTDSLPKLAGKKITLAFSPATQADRDLINSYLPIPAADGTINPADWPTSLPGYLVNLIPELRVDGNIVASGGVYAGGTELFTRLEMQKPGESWQGATNRPVAGEMVAITIDGAGTSGKQLTDLQSNVQQTQDQIAVGTGEISREAFLGDTLYGTALSYFGMLDGLKSILTANTSDIVSYRMPSFGSYATGLNVTYSFGVPRSISSGGLIMDIDQSANTMVAKDGSSNKRIQFNQTVGMLTSMLEHIVPEQIYSDPANPTQGVSAAKALAVANQQGQRIYTIDQNNLTTSLAALTISQDIKNEITNAVYNGQVVTTHEANITVDGWTGAGYIISDPQTGSGAYKISGGVNGGQIRTAVSTVMTVQETITTALGGANPYASVLGQITSFIGLVSGIIDAVLDCPLQDAIFIIITLTLFATSLVALLTAIHGTGPLGPLMAILTGITLGWMIGRLTDVIHNALCLRQ